MAKDAAVAMNGGKNATLALDCPPAGFAVGVTDDRHKARADFSAAEIDA